MLEGNLRWTSIPSRGSRYILCRFIPQKLETSTGPDEPSGSPNYDWGRLYLTLFHKEIDASIMAAAFSPYLGSFSNDDGDGNENATKQSLCKCFFFLFVHLSAVSSKTLREMTKFKVFWRTWVHGELFILLPYVNAASMNLIPACFGSNVQAERIGLFLK